MASPSTPESLPTRRRVRKPDDYPIRQSIGFHVPAPFDPNGFRSTVVPAYKDIGYKDILGNKDILACTKPHKTSDLLVKLPRYKDNLGCKDTFMWPQNILIGRYDCTSKSKVGGEMGMIRLVREYWLTVFGIIFFAEIKAAL